MKPLLRIETVDAILEYKVKRASLQQKSTRPQMNITREKGRANINTEPARLNIDSYESRASRGMKSAFRVIEEAAKTGVQDARAAAQQYAEQGNSIVDSAGKRSLADIFASKMGVTKETALTFIPSVSLDISFLPGSINFDYSMDQLTFDWHINNRPQLEFIPGSIEFNMVQYPDVIIEYLGDPIYVPPSANPNYTPPINTTV